MSAAHRVPWRALKVVPASVIGKTPYGSRSSTLSSLSYSLQRPPISFTCNPLSFTARRSFSARVPLLSRQQAKTWKSTESRRADRRVLLKALAYIGIFGIFELYVFWDLNVYIYEQARHVYGALKRSGRVVGTLAVCINE